MVKYHLGFWGGIFDNFEERMEGGIFDNFEERMEGLQNSGWWLLFFSTAIFHFIFGLFNYIF